MAGSGTSQLRNSDCLLRATHVTKTFAVGRGVEAQALSDVSFDVLAGETLGVVGESGCGKSTLARSVLMLPPPSCGSIRFDGVELSTATRSALRVVRRRMQPIFQDPVASLNPRRRVLDIVADPLHVHDIGTKVERVERASEALAAVGLDASLVGARHPHELSGGQCQRVSIARALVLEPALLICDEPVASLDVSVQAQVINLLEAAKRKFSLTLLFISHDLSVIKAISDRVMVMYLGKICEIGPVESVFAAPHHPYTAALLEAIPSLQPRQRLRRAAPLGEPPSPLAVPQGCRFHPRCPRATDTCRTHEPLIRSDGRGSHFACHHPLSVDTEIERN